MPPLLRRLCRETLDFAVAARLLPGFEPNGRFVEPAGLKSAHAYNSDLKRIAHYATLRGPLYADDRAWERAYRLVRAFTRASGTGASGRWQEGLLGPFHGLTPPAVLAGLEGAAARLGLTTVACNRAGFTAAFSAEDACRVEDLPEPYGKWLQSRRGRPRWQERVELALELQCRVASVEGPAGEATLVSVRLSAPAAPLVLALAEGLGAALFLPVSVADDAALRQRATALLREALGP